jgi:LmbE family N-acetylglucosaminyl deacetylase
MEASLFVFAHQDDEVGAASRIAWERTRNVEVWCVYLTDGARSTPAGVRDAESLAVLTRLGVVRSHVVAIADAAGRIPDGELMTQLDRACAALRLWIERTGVVFDRLYTLDWEGGHPDHDAACAVSLAVAPDAGIRDVFSFPMYNGFRRRRGWFRVASPVPAPGTLDTRRRLSFREALGIAHCVFAYPSQRRTWLGLGPGFVVRTLLLRTEVVRRVDASRLRSRPHAGALLCETLFGCDGDALLAAARAFSERVETARALNAEASR